MGAVYEVGALCALQDALEGVDFTRFDVYVGVSSGAFVASMLANGFTPAELREILVDTASPEHAVGHQVFLSPALGELAQRTGSLPRLALETLWHRAREAVGARGRAPGGPASVGSAIPTGFFDNERLARFLEQAFSGGGRSNDFRDLGHRLRVIATDLDTSEAAEFGAPGLDRVPVSRAVQASAALPVFYPPVEIGGRHYVDGALRKTMHASVALREGARLVFCINPIIPFDSSLAARGRRGRIIDRGLPAIVSQSFRTLIYSRMEAAMERYAKQYPRASLLLFQPKRNEGEMFFTNVFNEADRHEVFARAYRATLRDLAARRRELGPTLARYGISIRRAGSRPPAPRPPRRKPLPRERQAFGFGGAALKKAWARLHRGDCEPFPESAPLQEAWRAFHCGDFQLACERGLALGAEGHAVADKAQFIYATYLEPDRKARLALFEEAARRSEAARKSRPDDASSLYLFASCMGRHSQSKSVVEALAAGTPGQIRKSLERALELAPRHAEAHIAMGTWHTEVIDKAGAFVGGLTYGASAPEALAHYRKALALFPESAIARVEYAAGVMRLDSSKKAEARTLLAQAGKLEPADATESLDVELARSRLEAL